VKRGLLLASCLLASCKLGGIHAGSIVKITYTLSVDGKVVDERLDKGGYEYKAGTGQIPKGLDAGLRGLQAGDEKTVVVSPEEGYGLSDPAKIRRMGLSVFGAMAKELKVGAEVNGLMGGRTAAGRVTALDDKTVTLDFNHPLAGKTLTFKVKILGVTAS
jgi:FKBP-type peptidyl-prolyl cis-trans isomerase 2